MKKLLLLTGAIIALGGITSCSDDNVASLDPVTTQAEENTPVSFSTYLGNAKSTRSQQGGMMTTNELKKMKVGFGVFAYYTKTSTFKDIVDQQSDESSPLSVNYMNNEKVTYSEATKSTPESWKCLTTKYWPNPTKTEAAKGKLSPQYVTFLAYAPYSDVASSTISQLTSGGNMVSTNQTYGVTGFEMLGNSSGEQAGKFIGATKRSDVVLKYSLEKEPISKEQVDLLWGTAGTNGDAAKIVDEDWTGTLPDNDGDSYKNSTATGHGLDSDNPNYLTNGYSINSDLTKMTTTGKVQFKFKHALGAFGGFGNGSTDNSSGGGILIDYYADAASVSGNQNVSAENPNPGKVTGNTGVFVNWIAVEFMGNNKSDNGNGQYYRISKEGLFDLVTGQWNRLNPVYTAQSGTEITEAADGRFKSIYYFSPNATKVGDAYQKYLDLYGTEGENYEITVNGLSSKIWGLAGINTPNGYNSAWISSSDKHKFTDEIAGRSVSNIAQTIYQDASQPILFIPGQKLTVKVVVSYDIVTPDPNIKEGFSVARHEMAKQVDFKTPIFVNRLYALYIHLGLTSIKLDATVDKWATDSTDDPDNKDQQVTADIEDADISPNEVPSSTGN